MRKTVEGKVMRKTEWVTGEVSYKYYKSGTGTPEFLIASHGRGTGYELEYRHQQFFRRLADAKKWVEDFREWRSKRRIGAATKPASRRGRIK
jgi:hypothetical protein